MFFNSFWKKIFILNIGLLIVIYRIFNVIEKYLKKNSYEISLFPTLSEDGYPFFNSINCNIGNLISITKKLINKHFSQSISIPTNLMTSKECSFINKYILCKENKECLNNINKTISELNLNNSFQIDNLNYLYHSELNDFKIKNTIGLGNFINIMNLKNEFIDSNSSGKNKIEILFYHKIISGYYSLLNIKQYDNNIKNNLHISSNDYYNYNLLKQVTQYENKINDLFYLHSLILYSYIKINKNNYNENTTDTEDINIILNYANQCIDLSDDLFDLTINKIIPKNINIFKNIFMQEIMGLIDCIPDIYERNSFIIDFITFNTMIKVLSGEKNINDYEVNSLIFFLVELSKRINDIFNAEIELRNKVNLLRQNNIYIFIIYGCLSLAGILYINRYFIKNKDKYENKKKRNQLFSQQKYNFAQNGQKKQEIIGNNNGDGRKKLSQQELEYIQKLAKENKGDFLIAK